MTKYEKLQNYLLNNQSTWLITGVAGFIGSNLLEKLLILNQKVVGLDKSATAIKINRNRLSSNKNLFFFKKDINKFDFKKIGKFDFNYLRFFLHAINLKTQKNLFKHFYNLKKKRGTLIMLEFRPDKDPLINKGKKLSKNETFTNHYRRFINVKDILKYLNILSFKIIYLPISPMILE